MRGATHLAFAGLTGVIASGFGASLDVAGGAALAVGALLPDIDTTTSDLGKFVKPVSRVLERRFGHRTLTHSLLGMAALALATSWLLLIYPGTWAWLLLGVASHLILDTCNVVGVPFLWPSRLEAVMVRDRSLRVPYGSPKEFSWLAVMSLTAVALVPLSLDGFGPWFHRALGTPTGAVEDYLGWRDAFEVWVDVQGHNVLKEETVEGRFRVLDVLGKDALLVEDTTGRAYSVSLNDSANIVSSRVSAWQGERITAHTYRADVAGLLVSDFLASLPQNARHLNLNAALTLKGEAEPAPALGHFQRVTRSGDTLELRAATPSDLAPFATLAIETGSAVVRAEYSEGAEVPVALELTAAAPKVKSHTLTIPDLPSVAGLVVETGQEVAEGELIARYVDDAGLEVTQAEVKAAKGKIPELEQSINLEQEAHEARLGALTQDLTAAQERLEHMTFLVERGAEPRARLADAQAELNHAENAQTAEQTAWTSQKYGLTVQLRDARLAVRRAELDGEQALEQQWVRAPVAGTIADVRISEVSTEGVSLEVVLLERTETAEATE